MVHRYANYVLRMLGTVLSGIFDFRETVLQSKNAGVVLSSLDES
jgi:hypothetical protein